jgi:hypothetical protein
MNRRELLQKFGGALALNGLSLSAMSTMSTMSRMAMANPNSSESPNIADPEQYFVFVVFSGAWDPMLALDPRDPTVFSDSVIPETQIQTGYDLLDIGSDPRIQTPNMTFGPYIGDLAAMSDKVVLVRGMSMSSVGHSSATKHALTARVPSGDSVRGSSVSTVLSSLLGAENEIANLVVGTDSYNLGHPVWSSGFQSSNVDDFHAALSEGAVSLSEPQNDALYQFFERERRNNTIGRFDTMYANREAAQLLLQSGTSALFDFDSPDLADLKQYFGVGNGVTGSESENALMAYQALTNGVSRCVTYKAAGGLDSHNGDDWQTQHGPRLQNGFNSVASLASLLENTPHPSGGNWLSRTTIWCMSEFQRNPLLNNNFGRDHYITNSALLLGGGLVGGRVIGATSDQKMKSQKVDLATGEVDNDNGVYISHEHIARTLLYRLGVEDDLGDYREPPISALL